MAKRQLIFLAVLLAALATACTLTGRAEITSATEQPKGRDTVPVSTPGEPSAEGQPIYNEESREQLPVFTTLFTAQFSGSENWQYRLTTRKSTALREQALHIEGIEKARNPGDIRFVTDGTTSWMTGPGTDNECLQFPNGQGYDPDFLTPESFIAAPELAPWLRLTGEESIAGYSAAHYTGKEPGLGEWKNVKADLWLDLESGALLRYELAAEGADTVFSSGYGKLALRYQVENFTEPVIEPVGGCEPRVPLPESAVNYVRLPGLVSFESPAGPEEIANFYEQTLPQEGWNESEPPMEEEGKLVLSFTREAEGIEISLQAQPAGGIQVQVLFFTEN